MLSASLPVDLTVTYSLDGKVISDVDRTILAGIAFSGLQHNLGLSREKLDIPSCFEVNVDVKDFELGTAVTIAANGLTKDIDPDDLDSLDKLMDSMNTLESAMNALIDGSSQLYTGLENLLENSGTLSDGVDALFEGAEQFSGFAAN